MFKVINKTDTRVFIRSNKDFRIIPIHVFHRARNQKDRGVRIRKPVKVIINDALFIFKKNQWDNGKELASDYKKFCSGLPYLYKWESSGRFNNLKKKAKRRNQRLINNVNTVGRKQYLKRS